MLLVSRGFKKALLGPYSFAQIFAGGTIHIYASPRPSSADDAQTATPIASVTRAGGGGLKFVLVDEYVIKPPDDVWQMRVASPGTALWWRLVGVSDDGADTLDSPRIDGDIGTTDAPNDLTLGSTSLNAGDLLAFDSFLYTLPPLAAA